MTTGHNLKSYLQSNGSFENEEDTFRREAVIQELNLCFTNWTLGKTPPDRQNLPLTGRLLTLGSHKLGINGPGADIDVLLIVPKGINRQDLFHSFYDTLLEQLREKISFSRKIESTYVPVIKTTINDVDIDMAFCCFPHESLPPLAELLNDIYLTDMDIYSVRSLNGYRDCVAILQLVASNFESFQIVLRAVKLWASRRAIYNNSIGYFSGMALTVLVAQVTLEFPHVLDPFSLLCEFFKKYCNWKWPRPVMLHHLEANCKDAPVLKIWNPHVYAFDKEDKIPILTPAYPQRNSSYTSTISTRRVIVKEFRRANQLIHQSNGGPLFDLLFSPQEFFSETTFQYYIILSAESLDDSIQSHWDWCAVVRSQIRKLISEMELLNPILTMHVCPNAYPHSESMNLPPNQFHSIWFIGLILNKTYIIENIDVSGHLTIFKHNVIEYGESHNIEMTGRSANGKLIESQQFPMYVPIGTGCGVKGSTALKEGRKGYFQFNR